MITYKNLKPGQSLRVIGPDETGKIEKGIIVEVVEVRNASVTVKDAAGKTYKFNYGHGAEQLEAVKEKSPPSPPKAGDLLRQDGPTLKEWVARGYKAEDYPPEGYAAKAEPVAED